MVVKELISIESIFEAVVNWNLVLVQNEYF